MYVALHLGIPNDTFSGSSGAGCQALKKSFKMSNPPRFHLRVLLWKWLFVCGFLANDKTLELLSSSDFLAERANHALFDTGAWNLDSGFNFHKFFTQFCLLKSKNFPFRLINVSKIRYELPASCTQKKFGVYSHLALALTGL